MSLRFEDRRLSPIAIAAAAGGLAVSVFYVRFLGGLAFCAGEWARICWVGLGSATLLFLCGAGIRGMASSWLRVRSRDFRRLYALNVLLGLAAAASCVWLLWSLLAGPVDGAACAGGILLLMLGALLFLNHAAEDDRRRQMAGLARGLGLAFKPRDSLGVGNRLLAFRPFGPAPGSEVRNLIHGVLDRRAFLAFDCLLPSGERDRSGAVLDPSLAGPPRPGPANDFAGEMTVAAFQLQECRMPGCLAISRELLGTLSRAVERGEISFESEEFNRHYGVWASDRKFAYDVVDPRMMEFLLANPGWAFEVAGPDVMVYTGKRWAPEQFGPAIRALTGFVERIPAHVLANGRGLAREVFGDKAMAGVPGAGEGEPG